MVACKFDDAPVESSNGSHSQGGPGNQFDGNQGASAAGAPCCLAEGSQSDNTPAKSSNGSHSQGELGNQFDGNQGASVAGASCCLAEVCQATTWNDDGSVVLSPPPTGLVDWTSLHRTELSKRVVQSMGEYFCVLEYISINICILTWTFS
jgi:hypothetical protein